MTPALLSPMETGGRGAIRARRLVRRLRPLLIAGVMAAIGTGCATKRDIRDLRLDLRTEMAELKERQDSTNQLLQMQNRAILDSLTITTERLLNVRGELASELQKLQVQLQEVGQLTAQVQVRLNQLDRQLADWSQNVAQATGPPGDGDADGDPDTYDEGEEFYEIGVEQINRGNSGTARQALQGLLDMYPDHARAPAALRQIGETHYMDGNYEDALRSFDAVVSRYPDSDAAPQALYRAGIVAQERGNNDRARQYFQRVVRAYPNSDARSLAQTALERLGG